MAWIGRWQSARRVHGRETYMEVDLEALQSNVRTLTSALSPSRRLIAVVKANAYGLGARAVSRALWEAGVRSFAVATLEEGIALRRDHLGGEILILGYTDPRAARLLHRYRLTQTLISAPHAAALDAEGYPVRAHLKIDSGMHRCGIDAADTAAITSVFGYRHLRVSGLFTHLSAADGESAGEIAFTEVQRARFEAVREMLAKSDAGQALTAHIQNSAAQLRYPAWEYPFVRVGIALYGINTAGGVSISASALRPVVSLRSSIVLLREVAAGECVGYGCDGRAPTARRIALLPIGYADGIPRQYAAGGAVLVRGRRCSIVGRICMDQMMIDVSDCPAASLGDRVTLIGRDGGEEITSEEVAERCGTVPHEILCRMGERLRRVYLKNTNEARNPKNKVRRTK